MAGHGERSYVSLVDERLLLNRVVYFEVFVDFKGGTSSSK
jgi:hypothetical protein